MTIKRVSIYPTIKTPTDAKFVVGINGQIQHCLNVPNHKNGTLFVAVMHDEGMVAPGLDQAIALLKTIAMLSDIHVSAKFTIVKNRLGSQFEIQGEDLIRSLVHIKRVCSQRDKTKRATGKARMRLNSLYDREPQDEPAGRIRKATKPRRDCGLSS